MGNGNLRKLVYSNAAGDNRLRFPSREAVNGPKMGMGLFMKYIVTYFYNL